MFDIAERIALIREKIDQAAERSGRDPKQIKIVAVSKFVDPERIQEALGAGLTTFGENRVQEFLTKYPVIKGPIQWHMVGSLQTNKVKQVIGKVQLIHSLDRRSLAEELSRQARLTGSEATVLVQVNVSREISKKGLAPEEVIPFLKWLSTIGGVEVKGLMTIGPLGEPEKARPVFRQLRELFERIADLELPMVEMKYLSMGMTNDYEIAIEEGANLVRIGTGIFGRRETAQRRRDHG